MTDNEFVDHLEKHRHEFFRYILRNVWNSDVAEDVFSSAVYVAYKQLSKFEDGTNFRAWMYKILTNKCFVANRETKRSAIDIESVDEHYFCSDGYAKGHSAFADHDSFLGHCGDEIHQALKQLSTAQRSCLLLLAFEKYSYKEISRILGIPVGTVMTHLSRGRARIRRLLFEHAVAEGIITVPTESDDCVLTTERYA